MPLPPQTQLHRYKVTDNRPIVPRSGTPLRGADGVFRLLLEPIADAIPPFQAGQWVYLHLLNQDGSVWGRAPYSIANAPSAPVPIELGIKVAGGFTQRAQSLKAGDEVLLQGPWGVFVLPKDQPRLVMFAGGIGITPFLSMIREVCAARLRTDVVLFYSNRTCREAACADELRELAKTCPRFRLVETCTREAHPPSAPLRAGSGGRETGRIDAALLDRHLSDYGVGEYLMCGPRGFMDNVRRVLQDKGVEAKRIKQELFS